MEVKEIIEEIKLEANPANTVGMARYGINVNTALGISMPRIRSIAKTLGKNHKFAIELWKQNIHEVRILAAIIDEPLKVTESQMEKWVKDFDSWDLCDQCCMNLFDKTEHAYKKAFEWSERSEEFVKRAGFAIMASLAVHDKKANDERFEEFLPVIVRESGDGRNFVKKSVNWALRQIGKRNGSLREKALIAAEEILRTDSKAGKWIAKDAIRELEGK